MGFVADASRSFDSDVAGHAFVWAVDGRDLVRTPHVEETMCPDTTTTCIYSVGLKYGGCFITSFRFPLD